LARPLGKKRNVDRGPACNLLRISGRLDRVDSPGRSSPPGQLNVLILPMTSTGMRVALLEDDSSQAELLSHWLASAGLSCSRYERGGSLLHALTQESFDALLLDWGLPDIKGLDVQSSVPVIFVSARGCEVDVVTALKQGADDYMVKPVRRMELLARLEAVTRRRDSESAQVEVIDLGPLRLDCQTRSAWRDHRPIHLTAKDFDLSVLFLTNIGRLLSREHIRDAVWGPEALSSPRTLDTHICRVRRKLGLTPAHGWRLTAVYRHGYLLQQVAVSVAHSHGHAAVTSSPGMKHERRDITNPTVSAGPRFNSAASS
jgi:two-component system, OmpR family, response regulator RegX3